MEKCKICGIHAYSEYCWQHKQKKKLKSSKLIGKKKKLTEDDILQIEEMNNFFLGLWNKWPHVSEISGEKLLSPQKNYYFHHIIEKSSSKYGKIGRYDQENIILMTFQEHQNVHLNPKRYEEINKRREYLLNKYENQKYE